ncbi:hypothetical protein HYDPIDRAFT_38903 [Hydnomerulius pinastri MD-312]|nr:hypothetical protein HYDPIDRAFT_38903 [Hydnomerulius pinastri MD-312]
MSDFHLVDPQGWEYDLQSVYSAYMGYFQLHGVPWYDRTWGQFFETFEQFLGFSWPVITVTDCSTGRAHIVTRMTSVGAFLKMIKTRFGETLPHVDNILKITPFETSQRHLRNVNDWPTYKKLHSTLPAVALAAFKARVRSGDPKAIRELWAKKDKTFLAVDFEWSERNDKSCLEWGYAAVRCGHLEAVGAWPPVPETNYRKGHYIISEYVDKVFNKHSPTFPWQYAFGESQVIPKTKLPRIIQSVLSSLVSPDSETVANNLVLIGHGIHTDIQRLEEMKIKLPHNVLTIDTSTLEHSMFTAGERGTMHDPKTGKLRAPGSVLGLGGLIRSLGIELPCAANNAGNDAFMVLVAFQKMVDPEGTVVPEPKGKMAPVPANGTGSGAVAGVVNGVGSANGHGQKHGPMQAARMFLSPSPRSSGMYPPAQGLQAQMSWSLPGKTRNRSNGVVDLNSGVDEMGKMKRVSMLNPLTSPLLLPVDKKKARGPRHGHGSGSGGTTSPIGSGSGNTSPPMIGPLSGIGGHAKKNSGSEEKGVPSSSSGSGRKMSGGEAAMNGVRRVTMAFRSVTK